MLHGWIILDNPVGVGSTKMVSAIKRILQPGNLRKDGGQRRHLNVMTVKAAELECPGRSAGIHGVIIAAASTFFERATR